MNREETWELFKQGKDAWNTWAEDMLAKRQALEEAGEWAVSRLGWGENCHTREWLEAAKADFSGRAFSTDQFPQRFPKGVDFNDFIFPGVAWFGDAVFQGHAWFISSVFYGEARFVAATFQGDAGFDRAAFEGDAWFGSALFGGTAWFDGATFRETAGFSVAVFQGDAWFDGAVFDGRAGFSQVSFQSYTTFENALFKGRCEFSAIEVKRAFVLAGATFCQLPDFIQATFVQVPRLDDLRVSKSQQRPDVRKAAAASPDLEARWRALKRLAIQGHDYARELDFFAEELKARRRHGYPKQLGVLITGLLYQVFSDFGRSIAWPLIWLLVTVAVFYGVYLKNHSAWVERDYSVVKWTYLKVMSYADRRELPTDPCVVGSQDSSTFSAAIALSWRNTIPFAGLGAPEKLNQVYRCLYGVDKCASSSGFPKSRLPPRIPDNVAFFGMLQTILSTVLIFLFLLAVRNHFRIK